MSLGSVTFAQIVFQVGVCHNKYESLFRCWSKVPFVGGLHSLPVTKL